MVNSEGRETSWAARDCTKAVVAGLERSQGERPILMLSSLKEHENHPQDLLKHR